MAAVYLDGSLLAAPETSSSVDDLRHLVDAGFELVRLAGGAGAGNAAADGPAGGSAGDSAGDSAGRPSLDGLDLRVADTVDAEQHGAWLLTADARTCGRARPVICRTILVGPAPVDGSGPGRCDLVVRDVRSAVLEILASDAMG